MKVRLIDVYNSVSVLNKLVEEPLPTKVSFRLMKLLNALNSEVKLIEEQRLKLIKQYSTDGNTVSDQNKEAFIKEFSEFLNEEMEVQWDAIDINECDTIDKFDLCMIEVTKLFFSANSLDAQVEYICQIYKPKEMDI